MVVVFNTDTNAPVVEIQQELNSLLTFAPASLAKMPHYGYWSDYKTLVVVFRECVRWEREEGEVEGHSKKPLYVVFYGQEGKIYTKKLLANYDTGIYITTQVHVTGTAPVIRECVITTGLGVPWLAIIVFAPPFTTTAHTVMYCAHTLYQWMSVDTWSSCCQLYC